MIEYIGDAAALLALIICLFGCGLVFYNALVTHREAYFKRREALYYRLFDETEYDDADDRSGPYYED